MDMQTAESWIDLTAHLQLYVKSWTPEQLQHQIPIILLHDSLGSVALWRDFPEQLAQMTGRKVIAYDRLGFGQSSANPETLKVDFVSTEATTHFAKVLEHFNIQDFIVMGHSVGGGMASCCAAHYQDHCKALITMSAQAMVEELTLSGIREAKVMFQQAGQLDRLKKYHGEKAQWVLNAWTETWLSPEFKDWSLDSFLHQVHSPLLVIHGELDEYGSLAQPQRFMDHTQGKSQQEIILGAHHMPHNEQPELVLSLIQGFLNSLNIA
nr:alpha/beta hydrolase [Acinetobacter sp. WCHAc060033]